MKLEDLIKVALDELRMQMLGAQVLFGFQLQGAFQEGFSTASVIVRAVDTAALSLIVLSLGLLIAAPSQHRLVDRGNATQRIFRTATHFADAALLPMALAVGCDVYVVGEHYWGRFAATAGATAAATTALFLWYGLGATLRVIQGREEISPMPRETETNLHVKIDQMLTEARVILPGAQALLGFQFVVTMTKAFAALPTMDRNIHFSALVAVALSVMLLITPAAIHRITFGGQDVSRFHCIGSFLVSMALIPLAMGITGDFYVATTKMIENRSVAAASAFFAFLLLALLWYGIPLALRARRVEERHHS